MKRRIGHRKPKGLIMLEDARASIVPSTCHVGTWRRSQRSANSVAVETCQRHGFHLLAAIGVCLLVSGQALAVDDHDVDQAVVRALTFLAAEQKDNGSWGTANGDSSMSMTSLAVMAFLASGHTPGVGPYGRAINGGIDYVLSKQAGTGMLSNAPGHGIMYDHGISTLMLAEVAGMVDDQRASRVRQALEKAIRLILAAQERKKGPRDHGGWRYQLTSGDSDLSVTAWQLLALRAAKDIGCDVPVENIHRAVNYVKNCFDKQGFGYQPGHGATPNMTASGVLALQLCDHHQDPEVDRGVQFLVQRPLVRAERFYYYGVYYHAISCHKYGGEDWGLLKSHLFAELCKNQEKSGSWQPDGSEVEPGRVYATSLSVLALTVEYGYLPIYQR